MILYTAMVDNVRKYYLKSMDATTEIDFITFAKLKQQGMKDLKGVVRDNHWGNYER